MLCTLRNLCFRSSSAALSAPPGPTSATRVCGAVADRAAAGCDAVRDARRLCLVGY